MSKTFEQGKDEVAKLCEYFATNRERFRDPGVKEAHIRQTLIDPLFEALGWDVRNLAQAAPQYREVVPEASLEVEGQQKAPDYAFRVGTLVKFYAEAKKCGVNIASDRAPAYQLRRYGWSAKVSFSVLTDFEEFAVYDCTRRPRPTDKASDARTHYYRFDEYAERWRELWDVFSREAVWSGAFDKYASSKRKRGTSEVDAEFLKEIEGWRDVLARNVALRNRGLSSEELNAAVQSTIDRIVFLRMAEDRGLESFEQLLKLCEREDIYSRFMREVCRRADDKYNSGLFHFQEEDGVADSPDRLTPRLAVDDKVIKTILQSLYFAHGSPYHFGVFPVEILGTVYERFLGKVIRLTAGHQAKVEEKPEVRKAGGVYYTPAYIVDYIVRQTVGRQIEGRSPAQLAGGKSKPPLRVLDMACGSGSFLLGAYQHLLDHCLKWYLDHEPEKHKKAVYRNGNGGPGKDQWRLSIDEKKRILTTHVFGVDIDAQAVEVTKLSLLLKVLEGETDRSVTRQTMLFDLDRALPNLAANIVCGNSLIGPDYYAGRSIPDAQEMRRVNAFDWKKEFPDAMKAGGFDCVIGNPPYYKVSGRTDPEAMAYFCEHYASAAYKTELYALFAERALSLLRQHGLHSYVVPNSFLAGIYLQPLREILAARNTLHELVFLKNVRVFAEAKLDSVVYLVEKSPPADDAAMLFRVTDSSAMESAPSQTQRLAVGDWRTAPGLEFAVNLGALGPAVLKRLRACKRPMRQWATVHLGLVLESNSLLARKATKAKRDPILLGRDLGRYTKPTASNWFSFRSDSIVGGTKNPAVYAAGPRILIQAIRNLKLKRRLIATMVPAGTYTMGTIHNVIVQDAQIKPEFLLGLLNSRLLNEFYASTYPEHRIKGAYLDRLPMPDVDLESSEGRRTQDRMVKLVNAMLPLHERLAGADSQSTRTVLQRQVDATDAEIDRLVYELYGLTDEEIAIVEGAAT